MAAWNKRKPSAERVAKLKEYGEVSADAYNKGAWPKKPSRARQIIVPESRVLKGCMDILESHPCVALWWRQNTGAITKGTRHIKFSFKGASDLMAVMQGAAWSGVFLAVECKATGKTATPDQQAFLKNVLDAGGLAICVDDPQKLIHYLRIL